MGAVKMKCQFFRTLALTLFLTACASPPGTSPSPTEGFQLHTGPDGRVYRIETRTGKTTFLDGGVFREVPEVAMQQLRVGTVYRAEDGKATFRYSGNGLLEKWGLDKYNLPEAPNQE